MTDETKRKPSQVTIRLTEEQIDAIDAFVSAKRKKVGPSSTTRQSALSYLLDLGLKEATRAK